MENEWMQRTEILFGQDSMERLRSANVFVAGVGGVGAYAAEMLCRAGIGSMTIIDADDVSVTNINRQLPALHSTVGRSKVDVMAERFRDINPEISLTALHEYITEENVGEFVSAGKFDFIVDAIDTIAPKLGLIAYALNNRIGIVSSMGAGAKTDISQIQYADIWKTFNCGLSKAVRTGMKRRGLQGRRLPVVFCSQAPDMDAVFRINETNKKSTAGTVSYMTATFGNYLAAYVIRHLTEK